MKKDLLIVFALALVTVALFISGILAISELEPMFLKITTSLLLFTLSFGVGYQLHYSIKEADALDLREIIDLMDNEDGYVHYRQEIEGD